MSLILHISDSHLFADERSELKGMRTRGSFRAVLQHAYDMYPEPDVIILGGDMAQDESAQAYRIVAEMLYAFDWKAPVMISPGNHADMDLLQANLIPALQAGSSYSDHLQLGAWQVLTLSTHEKGNVGGNISEEELARLRSLLSATAGKQTLLALHHHPVAIGSLWLDEIGLNNRDQLWVLLAEFPQVKALLCGHIHQNFDRVYQGVRVIGSPSTCIQFAPGKDDFGMDDVSPGYRWLSLSDDGIMTGVERVEGFIPADLNNAELY